MEGRFSVRPSVCFEVQKITAVSIGEGNQRNYQVQWAPSWISSVHLVGCEHLIEEFICQQSEKGQVENDTTGTDMISSDDIQNDPEEQLSVDDHAAVLPVRQQLAEKSSKQASTVLNNCNDDHLSEISNTTNDRMNMTVLPFDKNVSNSGCQVTDMYEDSQTSPNHEWVERSIENINIDGDVGTNVISDHMLVDICAVDNAKEDQLAENDSKQASTVLNNFNDDHLSEISNTNNDRMIMTVLPIDKNVLNSGYQVTNTYEDSQTSPNHEWVEKSIEGINIDGDVRTNVVNYHMLADISGADNAKDDSKGMDSLLRCAGHDAEFPNVLHIKREETEINLAEPNTSSKCTRLKRKSLNELPCNTCHICHNVFKNEHGLAQHLRKTHKRTRKKIQKKWWECKFCQVEYESEAKLRQHKYEHTVPVQRPLIYKCSYCGKVCGGKRMLIKHFKVHANERLFDCNVCKKAFKTNGVLERHHRLVHLLNPRTGTNERPYECKPCKKRFKSRRDLRRHFSSHRHLKKVSK